MTNTITVSYRQVLQNESDGIIPAFNSAGDKANYELAVLAAKTQYEDGDQDITLSIPRPVNASDLGWAGQQLSGAAGNLGTSMESIMVLLHEIAMLMKESNRESRGVARELEQQELKNAAEKIITAAAQAFGAAVVSGAVQITSGAISFAGAAKSAGQLKKANTISQGQAQRIEANKALADGPVGRPRSDAVGSQAEANSPALQETRSNAAAAREQKADAAQKTELDVQAKENRQIDILTKQAQATGQQAQAVSQIGGGLGSILSSYLTFQSKITESEQHEDEAAAKLAGNLSQDASERVGEAKQLANKVVEILQAITRSNHEAEMAQINV